ncbi:MAG: hypothetical protein NT001_03495 [Candidatus Woesearchaeota archaeon]|nr:hypothetical protein [Candidatus Woesearchaeota archaeon]
MDTKSRGDNAISRLNELEEALKNSFSNIKQDMSNLKENVLIVQNQVVHARNDSDSAKKDFITIDKLNAMKIKIADMNEEIKKTYMVQEAIKKLDAKISEKPENTVEKKAFDAEKRKNSDMIAELKNQIDLIERSCKSAVTESRLKQLSSEVSAQINEMRKMISSFDEKGGKIIGAVSDRLKEDVEKKLNDADQRLAKISENSKEELRGAAAQMKEDVKEAIKLDRKETNRKLLKLLEGINTVREENLKYVSKNQVNDLLRSINTEFDAVKEQIAGMELLKKDIISLRRDKLNKESHEQQSSDINYKIEDLKDNLMSLNERIEENSNLLRNLESKQANASNARFASKQAKKENQKEKSRFSMLLFANILIALSFILLGVSFGMYYLSYRTEYLNYVIIGAVVLFVLGIIIRIISVLRE